ncbi:MAG: glycosyltransferase family 2 protein [Cyanobacteria bacterium J06597_16]
MAQPTGSPAIAANTLAIIPVLNEEETIGGVIKALQQQGLATICVVDNGSGDRTAAVAAQAGAQVVSEPRQGYGQACWTGLQTEAARRAEWILFCDGDGSDDLSELGELLAASTHADFVLGNRRGTAAGKAQLTPAQNFGNWLATRLIDYGWGYAYSDLGPLRLIRRSALEQLAMRDRGFGWTVEMQAKAAGCNLRICERPVNYLPRQGGQSKISGTLKGSVKAGQIILTTLAQLYWQKTSVRFSGRFAGRFAGRQTPLLWASALLMMVGALWAMPHGDFLNQPDAVPKFWQGMSLMGLGFVSAWGLKKVSGSWFWGVAIAARLILLAMHPGDDIWRYLWEGHIQLTGFNPYLLAPEATVLEPLRFSGWEHINHPDHAAIYPPVTLLGFRLLANIQRSVLLFKLSFVAADLGICWLLSRRFGCRSTLLYAWNPLVIYSFAGGGHYDSWFLLALVVGWLAWNSSDRRSPYLTAFSILAVGVSIAVKWMSLPVLLFMAWQHSQKERLKVWRKTVLSRVLVPVSLFSVVLCSVALILLGLLPVALSAGPFCQVSAEGLSCPILPINSTFVSYGRSAAFIPHFVAQLWPASIKSNAIFALPLGLAILWTMRRAKTIGSFLERYFVALMLLSPIIHAWYFTWLAPFAVCSRSWATRLVSLSAFVYFALPHNIAMGITVDFAGGAQAWAFSDLQRWALWGPFLLGLWIDSQRDAHT